MSRQQLRITCVTCKKRRVKGRTLQGRKVNKCLCQPCYDDDKATVFFGSSAGDWFLKRAIEHCTNSIPQNTDELIRLIELYKENSRARGWGCIDGKFYSTYDYELCHRDPCKGNGFTGALVVGNLFIGLKSMNQKIGNMEPKTNHGYRITEQGETLTGIDAREILKGLYDLKRVVNECKLTRKSTGEPKDFMTENCMSPREIFNSNLERLGHDTKSYRLPEEHIEEGFEMLHDESLLDTMTFLKEHGSGNNNSTNIAGDDDF